MKQMLRQNHSWSERGRYIIRVKARDSHNTESTWSLPLEMTITAPELDITTKGGFGISVIMRNNGDTSASNISWTIMIEGGFVIPNQKSGSIPSIPIGDLSKLHVVVFGLGKKTITISMSSMEGASVKKIVDISLFLFFVTGKKDTTDNQGFLTSE